MFFSSPCVSLNNPLFSYSSVSDEEKNQLNGNFVDFFVEWWFLSCTKNFDIFLSISCWFLLRWHWCLINCTPIYFLSPKKTSLRLFCAMTIVFISNVFEVGEDEEHEKSDEDRRVVFKFPRDRWWRPLLSYSFDEIINNFCCYFCLLISWFSSSSLCYAST